MQLAILSDVHANVDALRAVLDDIRASGAPEIVCLGDLVGYNSFPRETLALLRDSGVRSVHGNHDLMALARLSEAGCGALGRKAIRWTREVLTEEDRWYLATLPGELQEGDLLCVHSALGDTQIRLERGGQFRAEAEALVESGTGVTVCFTGHTHRQEIVAVSPDGAVRRTGAEDAELPRDAVCFVNPGTVGQPRDHDHRAAYALFDCERRRVTFRRVAYDRTRLLTRNRQVGLLPPSTLQRVAARVFARIGHPRP